MQNLLHYNYFYKAINVAIKQSLIHGRGVFSKTVFKPGQLIERAPILLMSDEEKKLLRNSSLHHYYFLVNDPVKPVAMGFGYTALYNHSANANAVYNINLARLFISIHACKKIIAGDEVTINYNGKPNDPSPVLFS